MLTYAINLPYLLWLCARSHGAHISAVRVVSAETCTSHGTTWQVVTIGYRTHPILRSAYDDGREWHAVYAVDVNSPEKGSLMHATESTTTTSITR